VSIRKGYVETKDGQIHYQSCEGGKGIPIVFFHQTASSSQSYEKIMTLLEGKYTMYAMDTPGFGQSFFPFETPTVTTYVEILLEAIANLSVTEFHVFGHHTGAAIAAEMAATAPDRVKTLMLEGPLWVSEEQRKAKLETVIKPLVIEADGSHLMKVWERVTGLDPDHTPKLCHREAIDTLRAGERWHEAYVAVYNQDSYAIYEKIRCPMLFLCGTNDTLFPFFKVVCNAYPKATSAVFEDCGTYAVDNCAELIVNEILPFLRAFQPSD
jgi:pimeloyl-ACP methyl ester carboxylesterase